MARAKRPKGPTKDHSIDFLQIQDKLDTVRVQLKSAIRQVWSRYGVERELTLNAAKLSKFKLNADGEETRQKVVFYACRSCGGEFKLSEVQVDHIEPVGKTPKYLDWAAWGQWIAKVFSPVNNLQVLCKPCHKVKGAEDRQNGYY